MVVLISHVVGGLAIFLYGLNLATDGLREAAGGRLRAALTVLTARRSTAIVSGVVVTFLLSSSSAVAVMLVDLADAGLLSLVQAVFILLGAGVGISLTVQIVVFPVATWALFVVAAGLIIHVVAGSVAAARSGPRSSAPGFVFLGLDFVNPGVASVALGRRAPPESRAVVARGRLRRRGAPQRVPAQRRHGGTGRRARGQRRRARRPRARGARSNGGDVRGAAARVVHGPGAPAARSRSPRSLFRAAVAVALLFFVSPLARAAEWTTGLVFSGPDAARPQRRQRDAAGESRDGRRRGADRGGASRPVAAG